MIINTIGSGGGGVKLPPMSNPVPADKVPEGFETIGQDGTIVNGTLPAIVPDSVDITMDDATGVVTANIPNGYVDTDGITTTFDVPIVDVATPTLSINENGLVTANIVQAKGWVKEVTSASGTMRLQVRTDDDLTISDDGVVTAPAGYYPNAASKTASVEPEITVSTAGLITAKAGSIETTHQITKTDIPTLLPGNIRSGVNICGVTGTVTGGVVTKVTVTTGVSGAVVTAKCGSTTQTGTCNSSGVATINLTMAGTWTITAEHPTNGAYSTNAASVTVQNDFPISLAVGSSTTVSATGRYTATLNMAYRPGLTGNYCTNNSVTYKWGAAAICKSDREGTSFTKLGGTGTDSGLPPCSSYSSNTDGTKDISTPWMYMYPGTGGYSRPNEHYIYNSYWGYQSTGRWGLAGATIKSGNNEVAVFAGGYTSFQKNGPFRNDVDMFIDVNTYVAGSYIYEDANGNSEYAKDWPSSNGPGPKCLNLSVKRAWLAGSGYYSDTAGYALFAGGQTTTSGGVSAVVDYVRVYDIANYTFSVAKGTCTNLSVARSHLAGCCHLNDYIMFGGGKNSAGSPVANVDAYSASRVKSTPTALSVARYGLSAAVGGGTFLLFAGGIGANGVSNVVDAYNLSGTRTTPVTLSVARHDMAGFTMGEYAVFACGRTSISSGASKVIDLIGPNMVRSSLQSKAVARYGCCGCASTYTNNYGQSGIYGFIFDGVTQTDGAGCHWEELVLQTT